MTLPKFLSIENFLVNLVISIFAFFIYWFALAWDFEQALEYGVVLFLFLFIFDFILTLFRKEKISDDSDSPL